MTINNLADGSNPVSLTKGHGGLPFVSVRSRRSSALISLYGGQILSFKPVSEEHDLLFLSSKAVYDGKKAIRGGIPVCWPWFGADPEALGRPNHGFARNSLWELLGTDASSDKETKLFLQLVLTAECNEYWPHACELTLTITVGDSLTLELVTRNTGQESIPITQALHAYFCIGDIEKTTLSGLENHRYWDKLDNNAQKHQTGPLMIAEEVDRIYTGVKDQLLIDDPVLQRRIRISSMGSQTAVVWNPWRQSCATMSDLESEDYRRFLCVEAATTLPNSVHTVPGSEHHLITNYKIIR